VTIPLLRKVRGAGNRTDRSTSVTHSCGDILSVEKAMQRNLAGFVTALRVAASYLQTACPIGNNFNPLRL
jgi:hypothetical protein